jgi:hypothetical protein
VTIEAAAMLVGLAALVLDLTARVAVLEAARGRSGF